MRKKSMYFRIWSVWVFFFMCLVAFFFVNDTSYSEQCEYTAKIEQCIKENEEWAPRSIENFVCLSSNNREQITYQIILDEEFRKIDNEIEVYLDNLESDKDKYFWGNAEMTYIHAVDDITELFSKYGMYWKKYYDLCWTQLISKVHSCQEWGINIKKAASAFENTTCTSLVWVKLNVYKQVAFDILMLNKVQVRKDAMKKYVIEERKKYNTLLDIMMVNIWYIERILKKWPAKIKKPY